MSPITFREEYDSLQKNFNIAMGKAESGYKEGRDRDIALLNGYVDESNSLQLRVKAETAKVNSQHKDYSISIEKSKKELAEKQAIFERESRGTKYSLDVFTEYKEIYAVQIMYCAILTVAIFAMLYKMNKVWQNRSSNPNGS